MAPDTRDAAVSSGEFLEAVGAALGSAGGHVLTAFEVRGAEAAALTFFSPLTRDTLVLEILPRDAPGRVACRLEHCALRYRYHGGDHGSMDRAAAGRLVVALASAIDARIGSGVRVEQLGGTPVSPPRVFGAAALGSLLAPEFAEGAAPVLGWVLHAARDVARSTDTADSPAVALDFSHASGASLRIFAVPRGGGFRGWAESRQLALMDPAAGRSVQGPHETALRSLVAWLLVTRERGDPPLRVPLPALNSSPADARREVDAPGEGDCLSVYLPAECGQSCSFCSIKRWSPPSDGGDDRLRELNDRLASARERNVTSIRIHGHDPLAYSRILPLLRSVKARGYVECALYSPCTRLADRDFCGDVVAAAPRATTFFVPVYAVDPAQHDAIVRAPGSHARVMTALDNLGTLVRPGQITIICLALRQNLHTLEDVARFALSRHVRFSAWVPYPTEVRSAEYRFTTPRLSEVGDVVAASHARRHAIEIDGVPPCVLAQSFERLGLKVPSALRHRSVFDPRSVRAHDTRRDALLIPERVPCPHRERCALATECTAEFHGDYVEAYGLSEFVPRER